jgi:hypothetical protein
MAACAIVAAAAGCGERPAAGVVEARVRAAALAARPDVIEPRDGSVSVVSVQVGRFERSAGGSGALASEWTARVRFEEPFAAVVMVINGTTVTRRSCGPAKSGTCLERQVAGRRDDGSWDVSASCDDAAWDALAARLGTLSAGYRVIANGRVENAFRSGAALRPLTSLAPCVEEGTEEMKRIAGAAEADR